jgi:polyketide biosynthesis acyl carrier protein
MERAEVVELVTRNLKRTAVELRDVEIDPAVPFQELGVTSIDVVEVVSSCMRTMRIKVPRAALNDLECLNDLVDLLHRVHGETRSAA